MPDLDETFNDFDCGLAPPVPLIFEPFEPINIKDIDFTRIKPRRWLYGKTVIRGYVSAFTGQGGVGKTSLAWSMGLSIALGRSLLCIDPEEDDHRVHKQGPIFFYNLEDSQDEMEIRLAGELKHHGIKPSDLNDKVYLASGRDHAFCVASIGKGGVIVRHDIQPAIDLIKRLGITTLVIDPAVNAHGLDGNKNDHIAIVVDQFRQIAHEAGVAILLIHHFRKGGQAGDPESSLGAVSLTNGCRVVKTVTAMSEDDATALGIEQHRRKSYVRFDDAKLNLSPAKECNWFRFEIVALGNGDAEYPKGDEVGVLTRWEPATQLFGFTWRQIDDLLAAIAAGPGDGEFYGPQSNGEHWVGYPVMDKLALTSDQTKALLKEWLGGGKTIPVLSKREKYKSEKRKGNESPKITVVARGRDELKRRMAARA